MRFHFYYRPTGQRLPNPASLEFAAAYEAAERKFAEAQQLPSTEQSEKTVAAPPLAPRLQAVSAPTSNHLGDRFDELYYTPEQVVYRWRNKVDVETLANWRSKRQGPTYHRFGRAILYRADLLAQWESKNMIVCDPPGVVARDNHAA